MRSVAYKSNPLGKSGKRRVWTVMLAIVLTMAGALCALGGVAASETYGVYVVTDGWTYDGTAHTVYAVAADYEGDYTVAYFAVGDDEARETVDEIVDAGRYIVEIEAEADDKYDAYTGYEYITVAKRALNVTVQPATHVYGNNPQALTATVEGLVEGDEAPYSLTVEVNKKTAVGAYDVGYIDEGNGNYDITLEDSVGAYTVTPRPVTVTADDKRVTYGDNALYLTATVSAGSILSGDKVYTLSCIAGDKAPNARTHAGAYPIEVIPTGNANYQLTAVGGTYTVDKRNITIAIQSVSGVYGENPTALEADDSEVPYGDVGVYELATAVGNRSKAGAYDVVGRTLNEDYDITFTGGVGAYKVAPRTLSVSWGNTQFVYDGTPQLPTITLGNILEGDEVKASVEGAATDAGVYTASAVCLDNDNYALPVVASVGFGIDKAEATFDIEGVRTVFAYTGETQSLEGVVTSGETIYHNNEFCEVGNYNVVVESAESANYRAGTITVAVTVREAAPIVDQASGKANYYKQVDAQQAAGKLGVNMTNVFGDAFADLTASTVTLTAYIGETSITFDRAAIEAVAGNDVYLTYRESEDIAEDLPQTALLMMDIGLDGATLGKGTATVSVPFAYRASKNEVVKVYRASDEGELVDMSATWENGALTFETDRFARYIVVSEVKLAKSTVTGIVLGSIAVGLALMVAALLIIRKKTIKAAKESLEE